MGEGLQVCGAVLRIMGLFWVMDNNGTQYLGVKDGLSFGNYPCYSPGRLEYDPHIPHILSA